MKKKGQALVLLLLLAVLSSYGCSSEKESPQKVKKEEQIRIGVSLASAEAEYISHVVEYMKKTAEQEGVSLIIEDAKWSSTTQEQQLSKLVQEGVDSIIVCPVDTKSLYGAMKELDAMKIPIINMNMRMDAVSLEYAETYVGSNSSEEATLAAKMVIDILGESGGKIGIIEGAMGSDPQIYRTQTFIEQLSAYPTVEIVGIVNGNWDRERAYLAATDLLRKNGDISVIYCHDSNMALGAYQALKEEQLEQEIKLIGIGNEEEYMQAIRDGKLYGTVSQPADYEGKYSVLCAIKAAQGEKLRPWYKNPTEIITRENVDIYQSPVN